MNLSLVGKTIKAGFSQLMVLIMLVGLSAQALYAEESIEEPKPDTYNKLKIFSEVLSLIESSYVESVESETIINGEIGRASCRERV